MKLLASTIATLVVSLPLSNANLNGLSGVRGQHAAKKTRKLQGNMGMRFDSAEEELAAMNEPFAESEEEDGPAESSEPLTPINISIQPAYHGIPVFLGIQMGWYEELGLDVNISVWDSGGPQVRAAAENDAWDFGVAGCNPNIIAGPLGISTVGISNDESTANVVVGGPGVTSLPSAGDELSEGMFAETPGSTGDLLMRECLFVLGIETDESNFFFGGQGDVIGALESGNSSYGALWAPNSYIYLEDNQDAVALCNGIDVGVTIPGGLMVRDEWAEENPDLAARALAVYLRGVTTMQNKAVRSEVLTYARAFYDYVGKEPSDQDIERDFLTRPTFNLDHLCSLMSRDFTNGGKSTIDTVYDIIAEFLADQGTIEGVQPTDEYLTDEYLQYISADADLRTYSYLGYHATPGDMN
ncbi:ABC-type nitrate sulfonate bicarbonate transport [Seminavis robusta]|uniref:ABC-type nitrate sulfonate bicarbonate transport n=1 Tax=Seminavis robusta TaxID=568900 RepID=A0A9N8DCZ4_9STRA|nr:ABC-type nitrate sulfonate bicarbonate transport [Seminavis robusta]|eukprot:Sro39_g024230.1 ABC-type nitrate sulfonate bicarbonate transport (413) ;mRNA; f:112523-113914